MLALQDFTIIDEKKTSAQPLLRINYFVFFVIYAHKKGRTMKLGLFG
jgi:hypothetical protein